MPAVGLKATIETIDNRGDFQKFMAAYQLARGTVPRRKQNPSEEMVRYLSCYPLHHH